MKNHYPIIFICGLGGTGKSTLANKLSEELSYETKIVRFDWYLIHSTQKRQARIKQALATGDKKLIEQEENPFNWNNFHKLKEGLVYLQQHSHLDIPSAWNQETGLKDTNIHLEFKKPQGIIICEGMYLLHPQITNIADFVIYIKISKEEANRRTEQRDSHRSSKEYLDYKAKLQSKYDVPYFQKYMNTADLVIDLNNDAQISDSKIKESSNIILNKLNLPS